MPEPASLLVCILAGVVGMALFLYGKKQSRLPQLVAGIALMAFPYFVPGALLQAGVAATLLVLLGVALRMGL